MRILLLHPNYHSGGAEIAGNWPPGLGRLPRRRTEDGGLHRHALHRCHDQRSVGRQVARDPARVATGRRRRHRDHALDLQGASGCSRSPRKSSPNAVTVLGGIHATFMYKSGARRGAVDRRHRARRRRGDHRRPRQCDRRGQLARDRDDIKGIAYRDGRQGRRDAGARRRSRTSTRIDARLGRAASGTSTSTSRWACVSRSRTWRAAARSPAASARSGNSGATTASATRRRSSTRSRRWCATTASASSSSPTRNRPSTRRSSSPSARS